MSSEPRRHARWTLAPLALVVALGCADFSRGGPSADTGESQDAGAPRDGGPLGFSADVYPLLAVCKNCHVPGGAASATSLIFAGNAAADYQTVLQFVNTGSPAASRLLSKLSGNGHGGGTIYAMGTAQFDTILAWIQQGAPP